MSWLFLRARLMQSSFSRGSLVSQNQSLGQKLGSSSPGLPKSLFSPCFSFLLKAYLVQGHWTSWMRDLCFRGARGLSHSSGYVDIHGTQTEVHHVGRLQAAGAQCPACPPLSINSPLTCGSGVAANSLIYVTEGFAYKLEAAIVLSRLSNRCRVISVHG